MYHMSAIDLQIVCGSNVEIHNWMHMSMDEVRTLLGVCIRFTVCASGCVCTRVQVMMGLA